LTRINCVRLCAVVLLSCAMSTQAQKDTLGEQLYQRCAACHLTTAQGVAGMFPSLVGRLGPLIRTAVGRDYLALAVDVGLIGSIQADGVNYQGVMPAQGPGLGEQGIAAVLNYVLETFNQESLPENWRPYTSREIAEIKSRYPDATGQTVHSLREAALRASAGSKGVSDPKRAAYHWVMHCRGCHGVHAQGIDAAVPPLAGTVSRYLHHEDGRAFLARVPGVAFAALSDRDVAELLNWVIWRFDEQHVPVAFKPYREDEVQSWRGRPLISRALDERRKLLYDLNIDR
jgi:cytochrome c553